MLLLLANSRDGIKKGGPKAAQDRFIRVPAAVPLSPSLAAPGFVSGQVGKLRQ